MKTVSIYSDGTPYGTKVLDPEGNAIRGVQAVKFEIGLEAIGRAEVELFCQRAEYHGKAQFIMLHPETRDVMAIARIITTDGGRFDLGDMPKGYEDAPAPMPAEPASPEPQDDTDGKLAAIVRAFVSKHGIRSAESIYQQDSIIEAAYEFIERLCDVVGYLPSDDDGSEYAP